MTEDEYRALEQEALNSGRDAMEATRLDTENMVSRALEEARSQEGPIVCRVFCQRCMDEPGAKEKPPVATVRKVDRGLLYEAEFVTDTTREMTRARRALAGQRYRDGNREVQLVLLDLSPDWPQQWPPRAQCRIHGEEDLSRSDLLTAIGVAPHGPGTAAKVTMNR